MRPPTGAYYYQIVQEFHRATWNSAVTEPLPKITIPTQLKDYRPIAIISCLCKMLERQLK